MGYRYFSTAKRGVSFPFGFGLSYTEFSYSKPKISKSGDKYVVAATIKNTGNVAGSEVVQLYVKAPVDASIAVKPESELKAFAKTKLLAPGESETVRLSFSERDIASFDEAASAWSTAKAPTSCNCANRLTQNQASALLRSKSTKESNGLWKIFWLR